MRRFSQAGFDFMCWVIGAAIAVTLRFDLTPSVTQLQNALLLGAVMGLFQVVAGWSLQLYRGRYRFGSFDEVIGVVTTTFLVGGATTVALLLVGDGSVPRSTPIIAAGIAMVSMLAGRFVVRAYREKKRTTHVGKPTVVLGAGDAGEQLVKAMLLDSRADYDPVALLDDDPTKRRLRLNGVPVRGTSADIGKVAERTGATVLVVAIAQVESGKLLEWEREARAAGMQMRVIPSTQDIVGGAVKLGDISQVTEEDLLGRRPIETEEAGIDAMLGGRRVLITGAGGSIGSELARQVHRYRPAYVGLLDRDESALHAVQMSIHGRALLDSDDVILADIRDLDRLRAVMDHVRPDVVFHAAALKHMPLLERAPDEAFKTNVLGTRNVLMSAREFGAPVFVNISTDKAANPENVLGYSKKTTERLTAGVPAPAGGRYLSVRFGNVLGSRGSVLTAFRAQIAAGGPVTVTDPEVTRFFMTIPEAVHLVLQAASLGEDSETLILDMGEPVKIDNVAKHMIEKSGRDIKIVYTGLRPGEKMHEELIGDDEQDERPKHPLITHVRVKPLGCDEVVVEAGAVPEEALRFMVATAASSQ
ncbi:MAG: polysaccharide biosynthesis protein [Actinobacteria bacterium]|nr:polysaccharide biosynthesis protein [Actinomycetota bacterium]